MDCCGKNVPLPQGGDPCSTPSSPCCGGDRPAAEGAFGWFGNMIGNCLAYAEKAHEDGKPIVGIMCEYTPRELIMAAGAVPACLCGGSAATIPAAEEELPANLCPLIKSTYGYHIQKSNPFLEMASLVVAETTCDGKKKMFELMGRDRPMYVLELPQKAGDPDAFEHWVTELRKLRNELRSRFGAEVSDDSLRQAIATMNRERRLRRELAEHMKSAAPSMTGRELLELKSTISGVCADFAQYEAALAELKQRPPVSNAGSRVRVLLTGVPTPHGAERVIDIIEDNGGLIVATDNCTGIKPIYEDVDENADDPIRALAAKYFHLPCSVMTPNTRRMELLRELARDYSAQCIIELVWQACLTYDVEAQHVRSLAEDELGIPYLHIGTDYSPSDSARITTRVAALFETIGGCCGG